MSFVVPFIYALILSWSIGRYFDLSFLGFSSDTPLWTCATYTFAHTNIFHLILNLYAIIGFYRRLTHLRVWFLAIVFIGIPFLAAIACRAVPQFSIFNLQYSIGSAPTVGASAAAFALVGVFTSEYKILHRRRYYLSIALSLVLPFLIPQINAWVHLYAFVLGFIAAKAYYHLYFLPTHAHA